MKTPVLAFDIETVPDADAARQLCGFPDEISDEEAAEMALRLRRQKNESADMLPLPMNRVVVISGVLRREEEIQVFSLAEPDYDEKNAIAMLFRIIDKYAPQLVSWNGRGFDMPVLHYRGMMTGAAARVYWESGTDRRPGEEYYDFRFNNYISRYHQRHLDLMDLLAFFQPRGWVGLSDFAKLMGLPGKIGMDGGSVWQAHRDGKIEEIKKYCECDALNTYLLFAYFQRFRGLWSERRLAEELHAVRERLQSGGGRWQEFLDEWKTNEP